MRSKLVSQALTTNPISNDSGNRQCRVFDKELLKAKAVDLGTANGLQLLWFQYVEPVFVLRHVETLKVIGYMGLERVEPDWGLKVRYYQQSVYIKPEFRKRGLGTVLYLGVLHVFNRFVSDPIIGIDAVRTWKSLSKYGYKVKMWNADTQEDIAFVWTPDGQPLIAGRTMNQYEDTLLFYV